MAPSDKKKRTASPERYVAMTGTLFGQSIISGLLTGSLYGLLAIGLSLSWGLLRIVNISHFALAFLAAYLTYQLGTAFHLAVWWSAMLVVPVMFIIGVLMHAVFLHFRVTEMGSMLVTFGVAVLIESLIQWFWTADFRKYETGYSTLSFKIGPLYFPALDTVAAAFAIGLALAAWCWLRWTFVGKALRASAEDGNMAAAFGVDHRRLSYFLAGLSCAFAGTAGVFIALIGTLSPSEISTWIGVVFAVVIIGGLGNPLGAIAAGMLIGVTESLTMAAINPAWAPLVSFAVLIALLIGRPRWY
jgi:branched-chain amino acid transport system permease protein